MSEHLKTALNLIEKQQKGLKECSPVFAVGEQLKELAAESELAAEFLARDLTVPGMGLSDAEKKIKAYADAHKVGNCACVSMKAADQILRTFYGIPPKEEKAPASKPAEKLVDFGDFF